MLLGIVPFGLVVGVVAVDAGTGLTGTIATSTLIFAGAGQLAGLDLIGRGAPVLVVVLTILVVNLRMLMYGASLAPRIADLPRWQRAVGAYLLTDQAYALSLVRFREEDLDRHYRWRYYLGAAVTLWLPWQVATVTGALVGATLPDSLPLEFSVPLMFLALLVPAVTDRPTLAAAVVSATVATVGAGLPANLGMLLGAVSGIGIGWGVAMAGRR